MNNAQFLIKKDKKKLYSDNFHKIIKNPLTNTKQALNQVNIKNTVNKKFY